MPDIGEKPNQNYERSDGTRSGNDVFRQQETAGIGLEAINFDAHANDIKGAIDNRLMRDGGNQPTENIPFGGYKITDLAEGVAGTDAVNVGQVLLKNGSNSPSADVDWGGYKITDLAEGVAGTDAVNVAQLDVVKNTVFGRNLLDNSNMNIDIRGVGNAAIPLSGSAYFARDRWRHTGGTNAVTINVASDGLVTLSNEVPYIKQRIFDLVDGKTYTFSLEGHNAPVPIKLGGTVATVPVGVGRQSVNVVCGNADNELEITHNGVAFKYPKLEYGGVMTRYEEPDEALELLKCQKHCFAENPSVDSGQELRQAYNDATVCRTLPIPIPEMYTNPTVVVRSTTTGALHQLTGGGLISSGHPITVTASSRNYSVHFSGSGMDTGDNIMVYSGLDFILETGY